MTETFQFIQQAGIDELILQCDDINGICQLAQCVEVVAGFRIQPAAGVDAGALSSSSSTTTSHPSDNALCAVMRASCPPPMMPREGRVRLCEAGVAFLFRMER